MAGKRPRGRRVDGVLLLDKPHGLTSNQALQRVKRLFGARKAGHTGSLDPIATGLLPVCFGEATKISGYLLDANKDYRVTARLGQVTATGDAEGEVLREREIGEIADKRIREALAELTGEIEQIPPMYSAVKHQGQRLYNLARQGVEVERQPRVVHVYRFELLDHGAETLELAVTCSKGTYVRTLIEDVGEALGCGAHVAALRRVGVEPYESPRMYTMDELEELAENGREALDATLLGVDSALAHWPAAQLGDDAAYYCRQGQPVLVPGMPTHGHVRLYGAHGRFMGVGEILSDGRVAPRRLVRLAA